MPDVAAAFGRAVARLEADLARTMAAATSGAPQRSLGPAAGATGSPQQRSLKRIAVRDGAPTGAAATVVAAAAPSDTDRLRTDVTDLGAAALGVAPGGGTARAVSSASTACTRGAVAASSPAAPLSEPRPPAPHGGEAAVLQQRRASAPGAHRQAESGQRTAGGDGGSAAGQQGAAPDEAGPRRPSSLADALAAGPFNGSKRRRAGSSDASSSDGDGDGDPGPGSVGHHTGRGDEAEQGDPWMPLSCVLDVPASLARV